LTPTCCTRCTTEVPPDALVCPACGVLIHGSTLKDLAAEADAAARTGDLLAARDHWTTALDLLPAYAQQHPAIRDRIAELTRRINAGSTAPSSSARFPTSITEATPWWKRGAAGFVTVGLLLVGKLKFLLLGLTKASTFISMFAFFSVYWSIYGWPLALGLVMSIYIHEMGHVAMLRRLGISAGAPLFIPGVGALVMLKQHVSDPLTDAKIGLAGPVWGLGAAMTALGMYGVTRAPIWLAIAQLTGFINLFNLIPVWQLDGSRGFHVLARWERWTLVGVIALMLVLTEQRMLFIVGGVAVWRALQKDVGPGDMRVLATFIVLVAALSLLAGGVG
jgi:Zn-dependent protease